jgi:hypothetical protein
VGGNQRSCYCIHRSIISYSRFLSHPEINPWLRTYGPVYERTATSHPEQNFAIRPRELLSKKCTGSLREEITNEGAHPEGLIAERGWETDSQATESTLASRQ